MKYKSTIILLLIFSLNLIGSDSSPALYSYKYNAFFKTENWNIEKENYNTGDTFVMAVWNGELETFYIDEQYVWKLIEFCKSGQVQKLWFENKLYIRALKNDLKIEFIYIREEGKLLNYSKYRIMVKK